MKTTLLIFLITITVSCNNTPKEIDLNTSIDPQTELNNQGVCGTYVGNFPAGEFKGAKATLVVNADSNCMITIEYQDVENKMVDKGRWRFNNNILSTSFDEVLVSNFKLNESKFTLLDMENNEVENAANFILTKQ